MRIIAGSHRGKKLYEYHTPQTRPTTDRVKENVFNVLVNYLDLTQVKVLDLFAGTGAYGIECLSRGALFVHFNDHDTAAVQVIKRNLGTTWHNCRVTLGDWTTAVKGDYDLIFIDPPYASDLGTQAINALPRGLIVFETDREFKHPAIFLTKHYGRAWVYFLKKE